MHLIDSNIFLEILQNQENKEDCKKVQGEIAEEEIHAAASKYTIHGIEGMLSEEPDALDKFMTNITSLMTLKIVETTMHQEKQILEIAINSEMDLDEGVQYLVAKKENIEKIISYDTDFDRTDLKRVEYGELVE